MSELIEARAFFECCRTHGITAATAESCTGGMIAAALTDLAGSSAVFDRGFVTYSNEAKVEMLGVERSTLADHGAVSEEVALAMASGALARSSAGIALAVTGIAGPEGGTPGKPVGLVWFGIAMRGGEPLAQQQVFENRGRDYIRRQTVSTALRLGSEALARHAAPTERFP